MMHVGDIMSTMGVFSTVGYSNNKRLSPTVLNTLHGTHDIPTCIMISPTVLNIPTVLKITPTVLMISPRYSRYLPTFIMISPTVLNTPTLLKMSPHGTHDIPTVLNTPTVLHTHYTGWFYLSNFMWGLSFVLSVL